MKDRRLSLTLFSMVLLLASLWAAGGVVFATRIHAYDMSQSKEKTDAIVVLTGGPGRINAGLNLLRDRLSEKMLISGVDTRVSVETLVAMWNGGKKAPGVVILGHKAHNTAQNAAESAEWARDNGIKSIRLVTSDYHLPRALLEFQKVLPQVKIIPHGVSGITPHINWLFAFTEYNKTILTWIKLRLMP